MPSVVSQMLTPLNNERPIELIVKNEYDVPLLCDGIVTEGLGGALRIVLTVKRVSYERAQASLVDYARNESKPAPEVAPEVLERWSRALSSLPSVVVVEESNEKEVRSMGLSTAEEFATERDLQSIVERGQPRSEVIPPARRLQKRITKEQTFARIFRAFRWVDDIAFDLVDVPLRLRNQFDNLAPQAAVAQQMTAVLWCYPCKQRTEAAEKLSEWFTASELTHLTMAALSGLQKGAK